MGWRNFLGNAIVALVVAALGILLGVAIALGMVAITGASQ